MAKEKEYYVSLDTVFPIKAENEEEAIEKAREQILKTIKENPNYLQYHVDV